MMPPSIDSLSYSQQCQWLFIHKSDKSTEKVPF